MWCGAVVGMSGDLWGEVEVGVEVVGWVADAVGVVVAEALDGSGHVGREVGDVFWSDVEAVGA